MISVLNYKIVNGSKSEPHDLLLSLNNESELEALRQELEKKHKCFERHITETVKIKEVIFTYKEK